VLVFNALAFTAALAAALFAVVFVAAAFGRPLTVPVAFTTVPLLAVDAELCSDAEVEALAVRAGLDSAVSGRGGGSILPFVPVAVGFSCDVVREAGLLRLACSIMPWAAAVMAEVAAEAADLRGLVGLSGEIGRAMYDLAGEDLKGDVGSLMGERGRVRLL
jgi:hypothetical protein